jgi:hypothetical protein
MQNGGTEDAPRGADPLLKYGLVNLVFIACVWVLFR